MILPSFALCMAPAYANAGKNGVEDPEADIKKA
nr:MAG TPA: hypothetical protein [Caudoviricetes sp.]